MRRRNETAVPLQLVYGGGNTGAWADIVDTYIAEIDLPAVGTMRITAADQFDNGIVSSSASNDPLTPRAVSRHEDRHSDGFLPPTRHQLA